MTAQRTEARHMTIADLAEKGAYRIHGRGRTRRFYRLTARGGWVEVIRPTPGAPQVSLAEVRERLAREQAPLSELEERYAWGDR